MVSSPFNTLRNLKHVMKLLINQILQKTLFLMAPLIAAVILAGHTLYLALYQLSEVNYFTVILQLFFECSPFFFIHYVVIRLLPKFKAYFIWLSGFILLPWLLSLLADFYLPYANWRSFSDQSWVYIAIASALSFINDKLSQGSQKINLVNKIQRASILLKLQKLMQKMLSLNAMVIILLILWVMVFSGIFLYNQYPEQQTLVAKIDIKKIINQFEHYLYYVWQLSIFAVLIGALYFIYRYYFIKLILAKHGLLLFLTTALLGIFLFTPLSVSILLLLPINEQAITLLPSENHDIFDTSNYQFTFWLMLIITPIIIAFERREQVFVVTELEKQKTQTELQLLQQQVNPHFLFNTLNNLYALTLAQSEQAPKMIMQLANLLRYTVYEGKRNKVTLAQEVEYLQNYLALQTIRNNKLLTINAQWPAIIQQWSLPPLLLIILLENAFKHGVERCTSANEITVTMTVKDNVLNFFCKNYDNNNLLVEQHNDTDVNSEGVGLDNLRKRLKLQYPTSHTLTSQRCGDFWCAELSIPLTRTSRN